MTCGKFWPHETLSWLPTRHSLASSLQMQISAPCSLQTVPWPFPVPVCLPSTDMSLPSPALVLCTCRSYWPATPPVLAPVSGKSLIITSTATPLTTSCWTWGLVLVDVMVTKSTCKYNLLFHYNENNHNIISLRTKWMSSYQQNFLSSGGTKW